MNGITETQQSWVERLEIFLEAYGVPAAIASAIAITVIIGIPVLIQVIRLVSASKDNTLYRSLTLKRIANSVNYAKRVANASKDIVNTMGDLMTDLSKCKRISDVKTVSTNYSTVLNTEKETITALASEGEKLATDYTSVPSKKAMKQIAKESK